MASNPASLCRRRLFLWCFMGGSLRKMNTLPVVEGASSVVPEMTFVVNGIVLDADALDNEGTWAVEIVVTDACESAPVETEKKSINN